MATNTAHLSVTLSLSRDESFENKKEVDASRTIAPTTVTPDAAVSENVKPKENTTPNKAATTTKVETVTAPATATPDAAVSENTNAKESPTQDAVKTTTEGPESTTAETSSSNQAAVKFKEMKDKVLAYIEEMAKTNTKEKTTASNETGTNKVVDDALLEKVKDQVTTFFDKATSFVQSGGNAKAGNESKTDPSTPVKTDENGNITKATDTDSLSGMIENLKTALSQTGALAGSTVKTSETGNAESEGTANKIPAAGDKNHFEEVINFFQNMANDINSIIKASDTTGTEKSESTVQKSTQPEIVLCGIF